MWWFLVYWLRCKLKFQTRKAKRIGTIETFSEVCDLISCTTNTHINGSFLFVLHVSLQNIPYKKSFELRGWLHVCQIECKTSPWKNVICPWIALENKGLRFIWTMQYSTCRKHLHDFFPMAPLAQCFFQQFLLCRIFFWEIAQPPLRSKINGPSLSQTTCLFCYPTCVSPSLLRPAQKGLPQGGLRNGGPWEPCQLNWCRQFEYPAPRPMPIPNVTGQAAP